ncbi:Uma2 family endonuclease [Kitasatospora mediocidica]|uniref:Uma2 family endonuclease n=1 Tax=Kitasatospora mediocidica TaxID=58352 RepID=UPI00068CEEBC|nr:Uma2 family endonuclease [Kitasatospora mediocidica]
MSALTHHVTDAPSDEGKSLLEAFLTLETPEGFKAELIEGEIVVTPPPDGDHETAIGRIVWQIARQCPKGMDFAGGKGLIVPTGRFIPDGTFTSRGAMAGRGSWSKPEGVLMVLEVTSSRPEKDRGAKRLGYAAAGIPLYLLLDRQENKLLLHSDPQEDDYHSTAWVPVGEALALPAPFGFALETDELL